MSDFKLKKLTVEDFNPEKYIHNLSQNCVGGQELDNFRVEVLKKSEEVNNSLRKNVYQNYIQFIETAKEISHLESEMYQLSHLLSEHKSILSSISSIFILDETTLPSEQVCENYKGKDEYELKKKRNFEISEKVERCIDILDNSYTFLHEDDMLEIDCIESTPLRKIHGYLFSEGLMVTTYSAKRRDLNRYKFESFYEIGSLAIVNVRDFGKIKHAYKLLAFPDSRIFQCASNAAKKEWLDKFDQAKKARIIQNQMKRDSSTDKLQLQKHSETKSHPNWLLDTPDELEVQIVQRHFEETLNLLCRAKDYLQKNNSHVDFVLIEINRKVYHKENTLIKVLMNELELRPDKSLQGGLRASRRAIRMLNKLGRSVKACDLLLKLCSCIMKIQSNRVKREGSPAVYVKRLSTAVFTNMCHITEEFLQAFSNSPGSISAFLVWTSSELNVFTNHLVKQVFISQTSLSVQTECVTLVRHQCTRLCEYGIDLCYQLDGALRAPISAALYDAKDKIIEALKIKRLEDKWIPTNYKSKFGLLRCLHEHSAMGFSLENYVIGDCWLQLTNNTLLFLKIFITLLEDCLRLQTSELLPTIDSILYDVFDAEIQYIEYSLQNEKQHQQKEFMIKNAKFLLVNLINLSQRRYSTVYGTDCALLKKLTKKYNTLLLGVAPPCQITKYCSSEYL